MELRKDYILDRYVYIAGSRKDRPREFPRQEIVSSGTCFFCPGNESLTPGEIGRLPAKGDWRLRWFLNKFPAVSEEASQKISTDNTFFTFGGAYGRHEIIAETPVHGEQLWDLDNERIFELLGVYASRISELSRLPDIRYVSVFKNHGREGGASLVHSHSQVVAMGFVPSVVQDEVEACRRFGSCAYCRVIDVEKSSLRRCFENASFVCFAPYASRFNYEVWLFPKRHVAGFSELSESELRDLSELLCLVLSKLRQINAPFNFFLHYFGHAHIEVTPRMAAWAGFEFSTGVVMNSVSPEEAAAFYREV